MPSETWFPDTTRVIFRDGPCAGMVIEAPARGFMPPGSLYVRPDGTDPRAGSDHDGADGYVHYFHPSGDLQHSPNDPWVMLLYGD